MPHPSHPVVPDPAEWARAWLARLRLARHTRRRLPGRCRFMLLRLLTGLMLSARMARDARPIHEGWGRRRGRAHKRRCRDAGHVWLDDSAARRIRRLERGQAARRAVTRASAMSRMATSLCCCWRRSTAQCSGSTRWHGGSSCAWRSSRKSLSDDAALEMLNDPPILCRHSARLCGPRRAGGRHAMARACTLRKRVERILSGTVVPAPLGWAKARAGGACACAGGHVLRRRRRAGGAPASHADTVEAEPHPFDRYRRLL